MRWLRIAIGLTVTLLTLLCLLPAHAAQGSGWAVLLDEQGSLQLNRHPLAPLHQSIQPD